MPGRKKKDPRRLPKQSYCRSHSTNPIRADTNVKRKPPPKWEAFYQDRALLQQPPVLFFLLVEHRRGCHFVPGFQIQQTYTLSRATGLANLRGVDADDLAEVADEHGFRRFVYEHDGHDVAVAGCGLDVDHAFAAARLQAVFVHRGAVSVTVLSDAEDEVGNFFVLGFGFGLALAIGFLLFAVAFFRRHGHADDVIALLQIHATHAVTRPAHGPNAVFVEPASHPFS